MISADPVVSKLSFWAAGICSLLLALFLSLWNLHTPSIRPGDEALHVTVTQGMLHRGAELIPQNEGKPYYNKPPLKMWLSLVPLHLLGESNFSYRILDGLAGVGTALLTFGLAVTLFQSPLIGFLAVCTLLGCRAYLFEHTVRTAVQDSVLVFFSTAALFAGWRASRSARGIWWGVLCGALIGGAFLVKHVAGVMPLVVLAVCTLTAEGIRAFRIPWIWGATATAVLVAGSYYVPVFLSEPAAWRTLVGTEVIERAREGFHNRTKSFFYLEQLFQGAVAAPPFLMVAALVGALYQSVRSKRRELAFLLIATIVPVVLYSIPPSRLIWYIAPVFPPLAILCGWVVREALTAVGRGPVLLRAAAAAFVVAGVVGIGQHLSFVSTRVLAGGDRIELDWLTEALMARTPSPTEPREVIFYRGFPPGPFERVYVRMLARGVGSRERTLDALQTRLRRHTVRFVLAPIKFLDDLSSLGGIVGYRFIRPSKPVPRWMLRQEWYVLLAYDPDDLIPALTPVEQRLSLQKTGDIWVGNIQGDHATDALGAELSIPGCTPEQLQVRINEFDLVPERWITDTIVTVGAGVLRSGQNVLTLSGDCPRELGNSLTLRSIPTKRSP